MISLNWEGMNGDIGDLMNSYAKLPRHIAKKHLQAAMKRALKDAVPVLKAETPKGGKRRVTAAVSRGAGGRFLPGSGKKSIKRGGALRRAATAKAKYYGKNDSGTVAGTLGYKAGTESRKAIWLEFGTSRGIEPRRIVDRVMKRLAGPIRGKLAREMAAALEKAANEVASGKNKGYGK
jgi:hypothetical protein